MKEFNKNEIQKIYEASFEEDVLKDFKKYVKKYIKNEAKKGRNLYFISTYNFDKSTDYKYNDDEIKKCFKEIEKWLISLGFEVELDLYDNSESMTVGL